MGSRTTALLAVLILISVGLNCINILYPTWASTKLQLADVGSQLAEDNDLRLLRRTERTFVRSQPHDHQMQRAGDKAMLDADDDEFDREADTAPKKRAPLITEEGAEFGDIKINIELLLDEDDSIVEDGSKADEDDDALIFSEDFESTAIPTQAPLLNDTTSSMPYYGVTDATVPLKGEKKPTDKPPTTNFLTTSSTENQEVTKSTMKILPPKKSTHYKRRTSFVFIKSHVPGSEELTNILSSFVTNNKLKAIIPKDNYNLGWPRSQTMLPSIAEYKTISHKPYDALCSGFTRFHSQNMSELVPRASYIGLLSHPMLQFQFSWKTYKMSNLVTPTIHHLLEFVSKRGWNHTSETKQRMFHNGQAWHLGSPPDPDNEQVSKLINSLENFDLILISEYFDESLVLLKRIMGWKLDDILYLDLNFMKKPARVVPEDGRVIRNSNKIDMKLFRHFNNTLWEKIAKEKDFEQELQQFKLLRSDLIDRCELHSNLTQCVQKRMTTSQLNIIFKKKAKISTGSSCRPQNKFVWVTSPHTSNRPVTNVLSRYSFRHRLNPALPENNFDYGSPPSITRMPGSIVAYDTLSVGHTEYNRTKLEELVPEGKYLAIVRDPVNHFDAMWKYLRALRRPDSITTLHEDALELISKHESQEELLKPGELRLLRGSQSRALGMHRIDKRSLLRLERDFSLILIEELLDESLVLLRRMFCWSMDEVIILYHTIVPTRRSYYMAQRYLKSFDPNDVMLYDHFRTVLLAKIAAEPLFYEEVEQFRSLRNTKIETCSPWMDWNSQAHRRALVLADEDMKNHERMCHLNLMDSRHMSLYIKWTKGLEVQECTGQPYPSVDFAFIRLNVTESNLVAQFLQRFIIKNNLNLAFPSNSHYFNTITEESPNYNTSVVGDAKRPSVYCCGYSTFNKPMITPILTPAPTKFILIVEDPAEMFLRTWNELQVRALLSARLRTTTSLELFLQNPKHYLAILPHDVQFALSNPISAALGEEAKSSFAFPVLIAERLNESIVLLRRHLCWALEDVVYVLPTQRISRYKDGLSKELLDVIYGFNRADKYLYDTYNTILTRKIEKSIGFEEEVNRFETMLTKTAATCKNKDKTTFSPDNLCSYANLDPKKYYEQVLLQRQTKQAITGKNTTTVITTAT